MSGGGVKRSFEYRFHPAPEQAEQLNRTFGCVRLVYDRAWEERSRAYAAESRFRYLDGRLTRSAFATPSTGEKVDNPRHERADRKKSTRAQRVLARKVNGSNNREGARLGVARIHARIADRRRDHPHEPSTGLVRENRTVVIEDLGIRTVLKNRSLVRAIGDAAWSGFRSVLECEAAWYGRTAVAVDRWFPPSKPCSDRGRRVESLPLTIRERECRCGVVHDRDVNAARSILAAGLAER